MSEKLTSREKVNHWVNGRILYNTRWEKQIGKYAFQYTHRSKENAMGRFGGGWDWKLGFQAAKGTLIIDLLVASVRVDKQEEA